MKHLSLRSRLIVAVLVVVGVQIVAALVVVALTREQFLDQVDDRLEIAVASLSGRESEASTSTTDGPGADPVTGYGEGVGAKALGVELSNSTQFASCQVKKVFKAVCLREPETTNDHNRVDAILTSIGQGPIIMKQVFADTAEYCMGQ